ncbi:MAG: winged helix-turn-helix domain-containing protein, partial [Bacteroidales bacterium]
SNKLKHKKIENTLDDEIENLSIEEIDESINEFYIDKEKIVLTKKEFEILYLLSSNPKQVFSREQILKKVWKDDSYILERTVDVHIARIRKKIGEAGNCIVNRSGYGYCMEEI